MPASMTDFRTMQLGGKSEQRRQARERCHHQQHHQREPRIALAEALEVGNLLGLETLACESSMMHAECGGNVISA